jgi:hypothetical protein
MNTDQLLSRVSESEARAPRRSESSARFETLPHGGLPVSGEAMPGGASEMLAATRVTELGVVSEPMS